MQDVRDVIGAVTETDRAWLGVLTALALYGGKKLIDAVLPRGSSFRVMDRFIRRQNRRQDDDG